MGTRPRDSSDLLFVCHLFLSSNASPGYTQSIGSTECYSPTPVFTKGGPATEYVLLPTVEISQILISNRAEVLSCEVLVFLQDRFGRLSLTHLNLLLFEFALSHVQH